MVELLLIFLYVHKFPLNALLKTLSNNARISSPVADCTSRSVTSRADIIIRDPKGFLD
ncbi:MAG: hypothetical protein IPG80_14365 [Anaerolineales bacterium]|uniref:hypothetical protein n=1 Tax=Candidatus Villigracilis vicinus TaxID=3140679 RepID=UPI003134B89A|nr:hypothetical protein [Anaerolineales bacterium]